MGRSRSGARRSRSVWVYVGLAALVLAVGGLTATALAKSNETPAAVSTHEPRVQPSRTPKMVAPKVVFIGDSYIGGSDMGGRGEDNWSSLASDDLGWRSCSFGVGSSGWTRGVNGWTFGARIEWALQQNPDMIVFANGIHDLDEGFDTTAPAMDQALAALRSQEPDVPVVVVGEIKVRDEQSPYIERLNDRLRAVAESHNATFIDATSEGWFDGGARSYLGSDAFHATDEGHRYMADRFMTDIQNLGISLPQVSEDQSVAGCVTPSHQTVHPDGTPVPAS
jgi:lysophospholipase L1-like esterase